MHFTARGKPGNMPNQALFQSSNTSMTAIGSSWTVFSTAVEVRRCSKRSPCNLIDQSSAVRGRNYALSMFDVIAPIVDAVCT
jgi:hypothetical protein